MSYSVNYWSSNPYKPVRACKLINALAAITAFLILVGLTHGQSSVDSHFCALVVEPLQNYNCTEYLLSTFDGFILSLQKIQKISSPDILSGGNVLFLHSALLSGDSWFYADNSTATALADGGYTVWIGNMRTSRWSFGHQILNDTQKEYWDWCGDELANYDFPAFVDYIYYVTNGKPLHFVGYSQGARVGIGAISYLSTRAAMLASVTLLAPVVFMGNTKSQALIWYNETGLAEMAYRIGVGKATFSGFGSIMPTFPDPAVSKVKANFLATFTGPNCCIDPDKAYKALTSRHVKTSYKNMAALTQSMQLHNFQAYDYGSPNANMVIYESTTPPEYMLANVPPTVPILVIYGGKDEFSTPNDTQFMMHQISRRSVPVEQLYIPYYAHLDFILSRFLSTDINPAISNFITLHNVNT